VPNVQHELLKHGEYKNVIDGLNGGSVMMVLENLMALS
jgi:hypothetical protein